MSAKERRDKFGWLNKVSEPERSKKIAEMMNGINVWVQTASPAQVQHMVEKRATTLRKTWDERGSEILAKINNTFVHNATSILRQELSKDEYEKLCEKLDKVFDL